MDKKTVDTNKFHRGNRGDGKHYWLTPPSLMTKLDLEFHFDFDPCPYPLVEDFDGLTCKWGSSNYVNPPFGSIIHQGKKKGPTAWVRKALHEANQGKRVVLVYPIDKWILMLIAAGAEIRNLGDIKWLATEDGSAGKGTGRHIACFILNGKDKIGTKSEYNEETFKGDTMNEKPDRSQVEPVDFGKLADVIAGVEKQKYIALMDIHNGRNISANIKLHLSLQTTFDDLLNQVRHAGDAK